MAFWTVLVSKRGTEGSMVRSFSRRAETMSPTGRDDLTKTLTPMLILGSPDTAAARFVTRLGLGTSSNYDAAVAAAKIRLLTAPMERSRMLDNDRAIAPRFIVPDCGEWLWRSLAAARPEPTPFDGLFEPPAEIETPVAEANALQLMAFASECAV